MAGSAYIFVVFVVRCGPRLIRYILLRLGRPAYVGEIKREYWRYGCRVSVTTISFYIYVLKNLGLIRLAKIVDSGKLIPHHYYELVPERLNDPCWENPWKCHKIFVKLKKEVASKLDSRREPSP